MVAIACGCVEMARGRGGRVIRRLCGLFATGAPSITNRTSLWSLEATHCSTDYSVIQAQ